MGYVLKAIRKIDGFRAECAGTDELVIFNSEVPVGKTEAAWILVGMVLYEIGADGDGENGGKGDLVNCSQEIFEAFARSGRYSYADVEFSMEKSNGCRK